MLGYVTSSLKLISPLWLCLCSGSTRDKSRYYHNVDVSGVVKLKTKKELGNPLVNNVNDNVDLPLE